MLKLTSLLTALALLTTTASPGLSTDEARETLERVVEAGLKREQLALESLDWKWIRKIGHCDSWEDALRHKFNKTEPVDEYHGHWQSQSRQIAV